MDNSFEPHISSHLSSFNQLYSSFAIDELSPSELLDKANILLSSNQLEHANKIYKKLLSLNKYQSISYTKLGLICFLQKAYSDSKCYLEKALEITPNSTEAQFYLANLYDSLRDYHSSIKHLKRLISTSSNIPEAYFNLANALKNTSQFNEALKYYLAALQLRPNYFKATLNLALCYQSVGDHKLSLKYYNLALDISPESKLVLNNMGTLYKSKGSLEQAEHYLRKALSIDPTYVDAIFNLANLLENQGKIPAAIAYYKKALGYKHNSSVIKASLLILYRRICVWNSLDAEEISSLGIRGDSVDPFPFFLLEDNPDNHLERARRFSEIHYPPKRLRFKNIYSNPRIRVGYFSSDFFNHATMHLMRRFFQLHSKSNFDIYIYSFNNNPDDNYTMELRSLPLLFQDISQLTDQEAVDLVLKDQIDIAVDLKGFTQGNRFSLFTYRLAPIQLSFLGFPGTTGSDCIDYLLADDTLIPPEYMHLYTEKVVHIPGSYQCNDDSRALEDVNLSREILGLPKDSFVFTCFNATQKISSEEFRIWMSLLRSVEGSVLWLLESNNLAESNLRSYAINHKVDPSRIIFANKTSLGAHLARHRFGDLFLDTFNYNAHTTASDALWAGMPLLTLKGKSFASRVSASLLTSLGLTDLITENHIEYYNKALMLATDHSYMDSIRSSLNTAIKSSSLFNTKLFTEKLEIIYTQLYKMSLI